MRIRTDGKFAYREDLVDDAADLLGENTRVGAVEASTEFTRQMLPALAEAVEHEDMTEELAEILSTHVVDDGYQVSTGVSVERSAARLQRGGVCYKSEIPASATRSYSCTKRKKRR